MQPAGLHQDHGGNGNQPARHSVDAAQGDANRANLFELLPYGVDEVDQQQSRQEDADAADRRAKHL